MTAVTTVTTSKVHVTCWALVGDDSFESCGADAHAWATFGWPSFTWPLCERHVQEFQAHERRFKIEPLDTNEN